MPDGTVAPTLADDTRLIIEHSRVMHPDLYEKTEKWPDGEVVIHFEDVLEPSDFTS